MLYSIGRFFCLIVCRFFFRMEVKGRENIPASGPFILAANHVSNLDPVIVGAACSRPLWFLAKEELFRAPVLGWIMNRVNAVPLKRGSSDIRALRKALSLLREQKPVALFPQGRRGNTDMAKAGVGFLYKKSGAPLVGAHISGSGEALPPKAILPRLVKVKISFFPVTGLGPDDDYQRISARVLEAIKT